MRILGLLAAFAGSVCLLAQKPTPEEDVRQFLAEYYKLGREGKHQQALELMAPDGRYITPGGAYLGIGFLRNLAANSRLVSRNLAFLVRHIQFLTPDTALAYGVWRNPTRKPPHDAGTFMFALVRKDAGWRIASRHMAELRSPDSVTFAPDVGEIDSEGVVTEQERKEGFRALFDGKTTRGWTDVAADRFPPAWRVHEGCLVSVGGTTVNSLRTKESFRAFELRFEWMVSKGGNSGIKYRLFGIETPAGGDLSDGTGYEYQVADDDGDPGARVDAKQRSGALYGVLPVAKSVAKAPGEWNESRIVLTNERAQHWLNGVKTVEQEIDIPFASPISLQHHSSEVRFRKLRVRPIAP